jgi:hypothetical protein
MLNSDDHSSSYFDLRRRLLQRLRSAKVKDQVLEVVQNAFEKALAADNLVLSRLERKRLLREVLKAVVEDMNKQLDEG